MARFGPCPNGTIHASLVPLVAGWCGADVWSAVASPDVSVVARRAKTEGVPTPLWIGGGVWDYLPPLQTSVISVPSVAKSSLIPRRPPVSR